ncbi:MAG: CocE/NonD family hydrolase [Myxococcota bacterium]
MSALSRAASALAGRWLGLPAPRCRVVRCDEWIRLPGGERLAARVFRPDGAPVRATLVARSVAPVHGRHPTTGLARLLAEQGHSVVVVGCRGLHGSEGRFEPFVADGADGAEAVEWVAKQPWCAGPLALAGLGYAGHAAWATLAAARRPIDGLLVGFAARDAWAWLHRGGALRLETTFQLALAVAAGEPEGARVHDLARALAHRPLLEADRVASRRVDWLRDWLAHPTRDDFWEARAPALPGRPPATLLFGSWSHDTLPALLLDHAALGAAAEQTGSPPPRLLIGPAEGDGRGRLRADGGRPARFAAEATRAACDHLAALADRGTPRGAAVRAFVAGVGWREAAGFPPSDAERVLHLTGCGRDPDGGRLGEEGEDATEARDRYLYDPADARPSGSEGSERGDGLRYLGEPLPRALEIAGAPTLELTAESSAARTDFTAELLRVDDDGQARRIAFGIARTRFDTPGPARVTVALSPLWLRLRAGERLRLDVSSSSHPDFDRHPNTDAPPAGAGDTDGVVASQTLHRAGCRLRLPVAG